MIERDCTPFSYAEDQSLTSHAMNAPRGSGSLSQQHRQSNVDDIPTPPAQLISNAQAHVSETLRRLDVKHGKARRHDDQPSLLQARQYVQLRSGPSSRPSAGSSGAPTFGADENDAVRSSKRRKLGTERHEDAWEGAEDVRMLNKAYRAAEDALQARDAENALLREQLVRVKRDYERKESEVRQDLLFRHIVAREQAHRDHEKEKLGLLRLVSFLKTDHEKRMDELRDKAKDAMDRASAKSRDTLTDLAKQVQLARLRETETEVQLQNMSAAVEHASTLASVYEGDLADLQRLVIEESEERERRNIGLPPAYDSLPDRYGYLTPYAANRQRDAGDLDLDNIQETVTTRFMLQLNAANRVSLALRQHPDSTKAAGAGLLLYHKAMIAFASACQELRGLLDEAIEKAADTIRLEKLTNFTWSLDTPRSRLNAMLAPTRSTDPTNLPSLSDLGLLSTNDDDAQSSEHPITGRSDDELAIRHATITATDQVSRTILELCSHMLAALDVREPCPQRLWHNRCAHSGAWLRLADDTLLQCLRRRLEATAVVELLPRTRGSAVVAACCRCGSEHCSGYCDRLHTLSYNMTMLKGIRRGFDKISSPTRAGSHFHQTWHWLKETMENERQIAANAVYPLAQQPTPEMNVEEMILAIQHSERDPATAAAQQAVPRQRSEAELAPGPLPLLGTLPPILGTLPPITGIRFPSLDHAMFSYTARPGSPYEDPRSGHMPDASRLEVLAAEQGVEDVLAELGGNPGPAPQDEDFAGPSSSRTG